MINLNQLRFKSNPPETPFAPEWDYRIVEGEIKNIDFKYIAKYLKNKEKEILKLKVTKKENSIKSGYTGLSKNSTTARYSNYNIFAFNDNEINKLKNEILYLHDELLKEIKLDNDLNKELFIQCWCNIMRKDEEILPHLHCITPNCYLGGHITIQCNNTFTGYINPINQINDPEYYESKNKVGKITLFPDNIPHFTNKHKGNKERITIAFDLTKKKLGDNYMRIR